MRTIPAGEFKAKCLAIMDEVLAHGETILITKRGKPVARISPPNLPPSTLEESTSILGFMRGHGEAHGDIVGPIVPQEDWELLKGAPEPSLSK